jgi:hypothetical protein
VLPDDASYLWRSFLEKGDGRGSRGVHRVYFHFHFHFSSASMFLVVQALFPSPKISYMYL